ncbi:MAG: sulfur carrier protein ThiS adenylyltransferase ThiF [Kiritimatiellae bacterium]|nr:sulfur carrier protein ThiS adenylyltransferase ThiF [Kiritimatiellia bacterium]
MAIDRDTFRTALAERHGAARQAKFEAARVAVCGLGGLGSNVAIALARAGVGRLHLIDFDRVEPSNLNRQQYAAAQVGLPKAEALRANIAAVNPFCDVVAETVRVTEANLAALLAEDDIVCEAFDRAEAKAMLVVGVLEAFPNKPVVAASGMSGLASANAISTRRVAKRLYVCGDGETDSGDGLGLYGARVLVCAAHQATMILRLIDGAEEP